MANKQIRLAVPELHPPLNPGQVAIAPPWKYLLA